MNIINKLTLRQLKKNKRRTLVTMFGVVISVAMIMAVVTIGISFLEMFKRAVIEQNGAWEAQYLDVEVNKLADIEEHNKIKDVALVQNQGVASVSDIGLSTKLNQSFLEVFALNDEAEQMFSVHLLEGRMPQTSNEIVIPAPLTVDHNSGLINIGEQVTLQLGERQAYNADGTIKEDVELNFAMPHVDNYFNDGTHEKLVNTEEVTYTIVGIVENTVWNVPWGGSQIALTVLDETTLAETDVIDFVGTTFNMKTREIFNVMNSIAQQLDVEVSIHHNLLRYDLLSSVDSLQVTLYGLTAIIMLIVIIGSVSLIYNAFGISVADRSKYLGMLASVGATKRQKRNSVLFEAGIISLVSIPLGLVAGYLGLFVTFKIINNILESSVMLNIKTTLVVVMTPVSILLSVIVSLLTILISAWLPARRASKITAIDAIRMSYDIKITKRQVKNNRLVRKIFGLEADIALKNLKRNKRRYQITVFSLVISIVLFISASYFTTMLQKANEMASDEINYQVSNSVSHELDVQFDREQLINHSEVKDYAFVRSENLYSSIAPEHFSESLKQHISAGKMSVNEDGTFDYYTFVYALDDENFNAYVQEHQLTSTNWYDKSQLNAILINHTIFNSQLAEKKIEDVLLNHAQGLTLVAEKVKNDNQNQETRTSLPALKIEGVVTEPPIWLSSSASMTALYIVMPESQFEQYTASLADGWKNYEVYIQSDKPSEVAQYMLELQPDNVKMNVWNIQEYSNQMNAIVIILNIFTYGFIALITFISLANIMNTISTGLQLRKREFAMLRSMGMTEKGFYRMINYESIFYGIKSLAYGIPISLGLVYLMYMSMSQSMEFNFEVPWLYYGMAIVGIFIIVTIVMYYSGSKIKKGSIVEAIKQENI